MMDDNDYSFVDNSDSYAHCDDDSYDNYNCHVVKWWWWQYDYDYNSNKFNSVLIIIISLLLSLYSFQ